MMTESAAKVTVGMVLIGSITLFRGLLLFITQLIAGIIAAALVKTLFQGDLNVQTTLGGGTTLAQGVIIEMLLTAQLVFTIFMLAAEKHRGNFIAPIGIGLSLFMAELTGWSTLISSLFEDRKESSSLLVAHQESSGPAVPSTRPVPRSRRRDPLLSHISLDLLGRADCWLIDGCSSL